MIGSTFRFRCAAIGLATVASCGASSATSAASPACAAAKYQSAEASLPKAGASWRALAKHHAVFSACDDGALAEGYSDLIVSSLARRWESFGSFAAAAARSPSFGPWAIRHIDASTSGSDLGRVLLNADECGKRPLCGSIRDAALAALAEQAEVTSNQGTASPDCAGPERWPASSAFAQLKNDGKLDNEHVDFDRVSSKVIASEKIGRDLWRQVFFVSFPLTDGRKVDAVVVSDASSDECSMSDAKVFPVGSSPAA